MPHLPNMPGEVHVEGWFSDPARELMYCVVTADKFPDKTERVEITMEEYRRIGEGYEGPWLLRQACTARVRDAVARLAGYPNHAAMVRDAKRIARQGQ